MVVDVLSRTHATMLSQQCFSLPPPKSPYKTQDIDPLYDSQFATSDLHHREDGEEKYDDFFDSPSVSHTANVARIRRRHSDSSNDESLSASVPSLGPESIHSPGLRAIVSLDEKHVSKRQTEYAAPRRNQSLMDRLSPNSRRSRAVSAPPTPQLLEHVAGAPMLDSAELIYNGLVLHEGEEIVYTADDCSLRLGTDGQLMASCTGRLFVTNQRVVFVKASQTTEDDNWEVPPEFASVSWPIDSLPRGIIDRQKSKWYHSLRHQKTTETLTGSIPSKGSSGTINYQLQFKSDGSSTWESVVRAAVQMTNTRAGKRL